MLTNAAVASHIASGVSKEGFSTKKSWCYGNKLEAASSE